MTDKEKTRIFSLDAMRIFAVCAVVMIHISADFITEFDNNSIEFMWGNVFSALSRFAVPVFLMISGALMLDEDKCLPAKKIVTSTVNISILTLLWSVLYTIGYNIVRPMAFNEPFSVSEILSTLFNGHYHMWYLYVLIGLYLITPLLRFFVKKENSEMIRIYLMFSIIVCFVVSFANEVMNSCLEQQNILNDFIGNFRLNYIYEYFIYYILGWYVVRVGLKKSTRIIIYICGIAGLITTFVGTYFNLQDRDSAYFISNNSLNVFLYSLAVFVFIYYLFENKNITLGQFWLRISKLTFGVYLIHCVFLFALKLVCEGINSAPLEIIAIFAVCIVVSFVSVFVMSKIPLIKKLIRE